MTRLLIAASIRLDPLLQRARPIVCLSRILLCVVALELLTMPVTQGLWTWDKFLHGGQDFELGLLVIVTCLCLLLLRAEQSKLYLGMLVLIRAFLLFCSKPAANLRNAFRSISAHRPVVPLPTRATSLPLLI